MNLLVKIISKLLKENLKDKLAVLRGFSRKSFFCFGLAFIILSGLVFAVSHKSEMAVDNSFFSLGNQTAENLFVGQKKIIALESPDLTLIQENSLMGNSPLTVLSPQVMGSLIGSSDNSLGEKKEEITEYIIQSGDNLSGIAKKFNISLNTLLWANNLSKNSIIKPGQKLVILPVSGVIHYVKSGDTITGLAKTYKTKMDEIATFNGISEKGKIFIGDILIIPNATMPQKSFPSPRNYIPLAKNYFICPISSPCRITQGLHWYNAVDLTNKNCGEPVFAAAGGTIQKTGRGRISGKYIRILHFNGTVTYYGHLSSFIVSPGQKVSQGQIIGYTGYTGYTIPRGKAGCHVHFDVRGAKNPLVK